MKLIFEKSVKGRKCDILPKCDVPAVALPEELSREVAPHLPEMSETDVSRHYTELNKQVHGVNCGFYPLGSCTMKYNPRVNEQVAALPGFTDIHPLQPVETAQGCLRAMHELEGMLAEPILDAAAGPAPGPRGSGLVLPLGCFREE